MPKIGKGNFENIHKYITYDIFYTTQSGLFYVKVDGLFNDAADFFTVMQNAKESKLEGLSDSWLPRLRNTKLITGNSEVEVKERAKAFYQKYTELNEKENKVILYDYNYQTETQSSPNYRGFSTPEEGALEMKFKYRILTKKIFGEDFVYLDKNGRRLSRFDLNKETNEIPWTQEMEDFMKNFSKSFDNLVNKMKPYFTEKDKILELAGRNILTQ